jgi:hypothetical protein
MKTLAGLRSFRALRNSTVGLGLLVLGIFAAYECAQAILTNDLPSLVYAGMFILGLALTVTIMNDWRPGLYILVAWILIEDFVRKYVGNNMATFFAKDVLAILLYISFFWTIRTKRLQRFKIPFRVPLLLFFWLCLMQVFNPASPSLWYGILGLRINFFYVPLIYVGYAFIEFEEDLQELLSFVSALILIVAGLGIIQSLIGPSFLNPEHLQEDIRELSTLYRSSSSGVAAYRPTSVFVSAGRFQDFLVVAWIVSLGYASYLMLRHRRGRMLAFTTLGTVAAASLMSASRGVFMWNLGITLLFAAGFLWGAPLRQRQVTRALRITYRVIFCSGSAIIFLLVVFPEAVGSRLNIYYETLMPNSPTSELVNRTQSYPIAQLGRAFDNPRWLYGNGTGISSLGLQYVTRIMGAPPTTGGVENGFGNLVVELGVLGLGLWIVLGLAIAFSAWKVVKQLRGTPWFPLVFAIFEYAIILFFLMMFSGLSTYQDFLLNAYFWLLLGILYRLKLFPKAFQIAHPEGDSGRG